MVLPNFDFTNLGGFGGGSSGGFDFGNLIGGFGGGEINGDAILGGITTGLNAVLPGSGLVVGQLAGILNAGENIDLVKNYGLSSWGASGSPEQTEIQIENFFMPEIQKMVDNINPNNLGQGLSDVSHYIKSVRTNFHQKRVEHSRAGSTKKANEKGRARMDQVHTKMMGDFEKNLRSAGFKVTKTQKTVVGNPRGFYNNWHEGKPKVDSMNKDGGGQWSFTHNQYSIVPPKGGNSTITTDILPEVIITGKTRQEVPPNDEGGLKVWVIAVAIAVIGFVYTKFKSKKRRY